MSRESWLDLPGNGFDRRLYVDLDRGLDRVQDYQERHREQLAVKRVSATEQV